MNQDTTKDVLNYDEQNTPKLTTGLNVLTILTFIGCAYELYSTTNNFISGRKALEDFEKAQDKLADAPAWAKKFASPEVHELMIKSLDNKVPLFIIGLVSIALCVYGAIEMRKLKKQGFTFWLIGEILPYAGLVIFTGALFFKTFLVYFAIVPVIFILLYLFQRKNLVK
jgi:hypothetical protein